MQKSKELKRLESIMKLGILDTPVEERFDRLTKLATQIFKVPISTVTIIDAEREWYKSCIGVDEREQPRTISFCNHLIKYTKRKAFIIEDTHKDPRFKNNPMVTGKPYLGFYAGVPLFDKSGIAIGAFCIKDTKPRKITKHEVEILKELGRMTEEEINVSAVEALVYTKSDWFSLFTDNLDEVFWLASADPFKVLFVSKAYESQWEGDRNELYEKPFSWLKEVHPEDRESVESEFKKGLKKRKNLNLHHRLLTKDGKIKYIHNRGFLVRGKEKESDKILGVSTDITEVKELEIAKTEFLSLASHQLRTPPTIIKWYCDLLEMEEFGKLTKKQSEFVTQIYEGNQRIINLINSLLNISRLEMGTFTVNTKKINLLKIAEDVLSELRITIEKKSLEIKMNKKEFEKNILSDPTIIQVILHNIIANAVNYNKRKGKVFLKCTEKKEHIEIQVKDEGIGIKKSNQKMIFSRFYRADNANQNGTTGSGLGLHMTKAILEEMGGSIRFESEYKKGTTFFLNIPKKPNKSSKK
jgi:signal transduction histidine kinase